MADRDDDDLRRRASQTEDRTVIGAAPVAGGPTTASGGAFDTMGGGDLGGPGARDPGDATSHLRDPVAEGDDTASGRGGAGPGGVNEQQDTRRAQGAAQGRTDAADAQDLQDETRAQADLGSANNNTSL